MPKIKLIKFSAQSQRTCSKIFVNGSNVDELGKAREPIGNN